MSEYRCTLIGADRKRVVRNIEADDEQTLLLKTKELGYFLLDKEVVPPPVKVIKTLAVKDLIIFCRQMSVMIQSGVTIIKAIDILTQKTYNKKTKAVYSSIYEMLQKGNSLSQSMNAQNVFPQMLINMVAAGESSGILETNLAKMAEHFEKENRLKNKVRGALVYPIILSIVCIIVVLFLVTKVLPTFFTLYEGHELPVPTQILVNISKGLTNNWILILFIVGLCVIGIPILNRIPAVRYWLDSMKLSLPYFGKLNRTIYSARCARAFSSLYASGIDIIDMLRMIASVIGNTVIEKKFDDVISKVSRGEYISTSMDDLHVFDPMLISMIFIGEESGSIDSILSKAADYFDEESDTATSRLVGVLEPVLIVIMALIVGFIAVAVMLPLYGMYQYVA
jgi:type IV pilus assembly protein PilC